MFSELSKSGVGIRIPTWWGWGGLRRITGERWHGWVAGFLGYCQVFPQVLNTEVERRCSSHQSENSEIHPRSSVENGSFNKEKRGQACADNGTEEAGAEFVLEFDYFWLTFLTVTCIELSVITITLSFHAFFLESTGKAGPGQFPHFW